MCSKFMITCWNYTFGPLSDCSDVHFWSGFGPEVRNFSGSKNMPFLGVKFEIFHSNGDIVNVACSLWHVQPKKEKTQCSEQHYSCGDKDWIQTLFLWIPKIWILSFRIHQHICHQNKFEMARFKIFVIISVTAWKSKKNNNFALD